MKREVTLQLGPGEYAVIISEGIASQYRVWSEPVELMVEPSRDGNHDVVEMRVRTHACPDPFDAL